MIREVDLSEGERHPRITGIEESPSPRSSRFRLSQLSSFIRVSAVSLRSAFYVEFNG